LGDYDDPRSDSRHGVPQDGEITFLPEIPGVQFNPRTTGVLLAGGR